MNITVKRIKRQTTDGKHEARLQITYLTKDLYL